MASQRINSDDLSGLMMLERRKHESTVVDMEGITGGSDLKPLLPSNVDSISTQSIKSGNPEDRLYSLDVFRGMTVVAMIVVDYCGAFWSEINHSPWDGITFADFVVPAFLFMVGFSLTLAYKALNNYKTAIKKIILRAMKIFFLGLLLQGGYLHGVKDLSYGVDLRFLRVMGVLQRIAIAYVIVALCELCRVKQHTANANESFIDIVKIYKWHWLTALVLTALYLGLFYGIYVPDWHVEVLHDTSISSNDVSSLLVECKVRGSMSPSCNAVGFVDRLILGASHLYRKPAYRRLKECHLAKYYSTEIPTHGVPSWCLAPFDPEGLLSSIPAVITCFVGAHYGHMLRHMKGQKQKLVNWTTSGFVMLFVGMLLQSAGMPLNKQLYTLSYMFVTGGVVALAFTTTYVVVDIYKWRLWTASFKWIGAHALMVYALLASDVLPIALQGVYWKSPTNNIIHILLRSLGF